MLLLRQEFTVMSDQRAVKGVASRNLAPESHFSLQFFLSSFFEIQAALGPSKIQTSFGLSFFIDSVIQIFTNIDIGVNYLWL